eukprot:759544-Hanusia_phi.AAC.1
MQQPPVSLFRPLALHKRQFRNLSSPCPCPCSSSLRLPQQPTRVQTSRLREESVLQARVVLRRNDVSAGGGRADKLSVACVGDKKVFHDLLLEPLHQPIRQDAKRARRAPRRRPPSLSASPARL